MFNFNNPISRLTVRKYKALGKFLGSILERVTMESLKIETVCGMDLMLQHLMSTNNQIEEQNRANMVEMQNLQQYVKGVKNPIDAAFTLHRQIGTIQENGEF